MLCKVEELRVNGKPLPLIANTIPRPILPYSCFTGSRMRLAAGDKVHDLQPLLPQSWLVRSA
jgi:hypothetical protein